MIGGGIVGGNAIRVISPLSLATGATRYPRVGHCQLLIAAAGMLVGRGVFRFGERLNVRVERSPAAAVGRKRVVRGMVLVKADAQLLEIAGTAHAVGATRRSMEGMRIAVNTATIPIKTTSSISVNPFDSARRVIERAMRKTSGCDVLANFGQWVLAKGVLANSAFGQANGTAVGQHHPCIRPSPLRSWARMRGGATSDGSRSSSVTPQTISYGWPSVGEINSVDGSP